MFERITFEQHIMGGEHAFEECGSLSHSSQILAEYPDLESEDIRESLQYAAALASEEVHPLSGSRP